MDVSEKWGKSVDNAVELALEELKCSRDEVDVTVLEEPSRGFLGFGAKLALVRVERKKEPQKKEVKEVKEVKVEKEKKIEDKKSNISPKKNEEVEKIQPDKFEKIEEESDVSKHGEPFVSDIDAAELTPCENHIALDFLKEVSEQMGLNLNVTAKAGDDCLLLNIEGKDSGTIIGKRGQTLDAIQYLTSLVVNKESENYIRVVVDAENYRSKRQKTLEALAKRLAEKAVRTRRSVRLEPMNPYERKVIHAALQSHGKVTTRSEGKDPYRRVVIELK